MPFIGVLGFAQPLLLTALIVLPAIWLLLRVIPPGPRRLVFPPVRLLFGLADETKTSARMPWWLLALRLIIAALLILGVAGPVLQPVPGASGKGPLLLVVDDGFAAAPGWRATVDGIERVLVSAKREDRPVLLLRTSGTRDGIRVQATTAANAEADLMRRGPNAWPVDRQAAAVALGDLNDRPALAWWFTDGVASGERASIAAALLADQLKALATTRLVPPDGASTPLLLRPGNPDDRGLSFAVERAAAAPARPVRILAAAGMGEVLAHAEAVIPAGSQRVTGSITLPGDLRNKVERLEIEGRRGAGEVVLIDERWRRRSVGIVGTADQAADQPLLTETWYIERALSPFADLRRGSVQDLVDGAPSAIVLPDAATLTNSDRTALQAWIGKGGVAIRFAGPKLAAGDDPLVPVPLRAGDRQLGGALTWEKPLKLAPFPTNGPLAGLVTPGDVTVRRQVLARPSPSLNDATLASLADGTPLVTGTRRDDGWLVLVHTSADPSWTDLPLSGVFVDMLRRLTDLGRGDARSVAGNLRPLMVLTGNGTLAAAPPDVTSVPAKGFMDLAASATTPPGYWSTAEMGAADDEAPRRALDVAQNLPAFEVINGRVLGLSEVRVGPGSETELGPTLLTIAFILALADLLVTMALRGLLPLGRLRSASAATAAVALALLAMSGPLMAQQANGDIGRALEATETTRLAWVKTGILKVDEISAAGLEGLSLVLRDRTSVEADEPLAVDVERDDLALYPLLYWPVPPSIPLCPSRRCKRSVRTCGRAG